MKEKANYAALKEAIETAERALDELKNDSSHKAKNRIKKINKSLESAYEVFNKKIDDAKIIDKRTDNVWLSLMDSSNYLSILLFFVGVMLSGVMIYTMFQAYSVMEHYDAFHHRHYDISQQDSELIDVEYEQGKVISMYDQFSVSDEEGEKNPKQTFTIRNDGSKIGTAFYSVYYKVNLVPLNKPNAKLIDLKYIKYKYRYYDSFKDEYSEYKTGTLDELVNEEGKIVLNTDYQDRDSHHDYEVVFWISSFAGDDQMGRTFTFAFQVDAAIANA